MELALRQGFVERWRRYFGAAPLPICATYTDTVDAASAEASAQVGRCLICNVAHVAEGMPYVYSAKTPGCPGGKRYTGYVQTLRPDFEYFLSCGIPGKMEGERYKQSPELVREYLQNAPPFEAPGAYLVFRRWDQVPEDETPDLAIFFATPDVLAGLFTLANYDRHDPHGVIAPMGSGCSSIISYPYAEGQSKEPRCVLGMFDVSARPCVDAGALTFAVPLNRLAQMTANMDESFLITGSWQVVEERIG